MTPRTKENPAQPTFRERMLFRLVAKLERQITDWRNEAVVRGDDATGTFYRSVADQVEAALYTSRDEALPVRTEVRPLVDSNEHPWYGRSPIQPLKPISAKDVGYSMNPVSASCLRAFSTVLTASGSTSSSVRLRNSGREMPPTVVASAGNHFSMRVRISRADSASMRIRRR